MKRIKTIFSRVMWALFSFVLMLALLLAIVLTFFEVQLPNVGTLKDVQLQVPLRVYTSDGKLIAQFGIMRRTPVTLEQIPKPLINALLATEDARFYEHHGVDPVGVLRAGIAVITAGKKVQGASTITMQVARNFFLTREKTYSRKITEILLALKIDRELPKDRILELYLNKIYFGNRAYGVAAAAEVYYGKSLNELTLPQMAMLAGLPQAPSSNNPITNPDAALKRRNHVLQRMLEVGSIDQKTYNAAIKAPLTESYHGLNVQVDAPYIAEMTRQAMVDEYGDSAYERGLTVYTTINSGLQKAANDSLMKGLMQYDLRHGYRKPTDNLEKLNSSEWTQALASRPTVYNLQPAAVQSVTDATITALLANNKTIQIDQAGWQWAQAELENGMVGPKPTSATSLVKPGDVIYVRHGKNNWHLAQLPEAQGALVSLNPNNGAILALSGGFSYQTSSFNRAIQAERQPGSSFKPFIYSAALDKGYTLASMINDAPIVQEDSGENQFWRPENDTDKFYGPTSLRTALIQSRNLVSIRLLQQIEIPYALNFVQKFGFDPNALPHTLSLALGTGLVTPLQMASGFSIFANGGYRVEPFFIQEVDDQDETVLFKANPPMACQKCLANPSLPASEMPDPLAPRVLSVENAYLMTHVMQGVIQSGTGSAAKVLGRSDLAGKTGTSNNYADGWFSGFNSNLETTVWVGFDNLKSLQEYGATTALPIWIDYMRVALNGAPEATMPQPEDIVTVRIDPRTGMLATPDQKDAFFEVFRQQDAPHTYTSSTPVDTDAPAANDGGGSSGGGGDDADAEQHLF